MIPADYLIPYLASNVIAAALVLVAFRRPRLARALFVIVFLTAGYC